jgi:hypothetical protein
MTSGMIARRQMMTNRNSYLRRWAAIGAVLALTGCAAYPGEPDGYAMGYYNGPINDGLYGYDDFGIGARGPYSHGYHDGHWDHGGWDHHGAGGAHFAWHGAPGGGSSHVSMADHFGGMGGHGGGGHGRG